MKHLPETQKIDIIISNLLLYENKTKPTANESQHKIGFLLFCVWALGGVCLGMVDSNSVSHHTTVSLSWSHFLYYAVIKKCIYITSKVGRLLDKLIYRQRPYLVLSNFTFVEEWLRFGWGGSQMRGLRILIACFRAPGTRLTVSLSRHVRKHPSTHRLSLVSW